MRKFEIGQRVVVYDHHNGRRVGTVENTYNNNVIRVAFSAKDLDIFHVKQCRKIRSRRRKPREFFLIYWNGEFGVTKYESAEEAHQARDTQSWIQEIG